MPEYTLLTLLGIIGVVLLELLWARTGIFRTARYWISMAIVLSFQIPVDGWLTKLSDPVVLYSPRDFSGVRFPWDIPVEDFGFGFAMVTLTLMLWQRAEHREPGPDARQTRAASPRPTHSRERHPDEHL